MVNKNKNADFRLRSREARAVPTQAHPPTSEGGGARLSTRTSFTRLMFPIGETAPPSGRALGITVCALGYGMEAGGSFWSLWPLSAPQSRIHTVPPQEKTFRAPCLTFCASVERVLVLMRGPFSGSSVGTMMRSGGGSIDKKITISSSYKRSS